ncbi:MAG: FtsX-like permease family protein, partial [Bacteroidota bacterium]
KNRIDLTLQPLGDVYFQSEVQYDPVRHGNKSSIYVFSAIGIFIFIIACINFMNLATAKSVQRAKEVGVRKTLGSSKRLLALQFFGESIFVAIISVILAFTLTEISLPFFNEWFSLELVAVRDPLIIIPLAFGLVLVTGFISGVYPAVILSRFKPAEVLKGKVQSNKEGLTIRKGLVILQFGISVFLIVITLVVGKQLRFINEADLGFDKDEIVLLELNYSTINQNIETFKNRLLTNSSIKNVTLASGEPGGFHDTMASEVEGLEDRPRFRTLFTDENYIPTYDLEMVAGRNFSEEFSTDLEGALILNERAVRDLGMTNEDIIGKRIHTEFVDTTYKLVIGVVKDYHFGTLKTEVEPLMIHMTDQASLMSIKLQAGGDAKAALAFIESEWEKFVPFKPDFRFLDDKLDYLYQNERLQGRLFQLFSGVSIFIACLGIFGLASFTATQRRKEIGIRKALGASVKSISNLLARDYIKLVLIANIVALPVGWYLASKWLSEFTYRTSIDLSIFIIALVAALLIAILSVIFQSLRAALANPVDVLKEE